MKQIPLAIGVEPLPTFEGFVPGANAAAVQHLLALQPAAAPVYLWGPQGCGKTHLLRALAHRLQRAGQRVGWFDAHQGLPWNLQPDWALLVMDRCDEFSPAAQQAAFALFVEAGTHGVQVAAAGRLPPVDLPLRDDLRTRLAWGHVFALQPLSEPETRSALRREADRRGIFLSDEVMDFVLNRFSRDLNTLMQLLDRLDHYSLARGRQVTLPLLRRMLADDDTPGPDAAAFSAGQAA